MKKHAYCDAFYVENGRNDSSLRLAELLSALGGSPLRTSEGDSKNAASPNGGNVRISAISDDENDKFVRNPINKSNDFDVFDENSMKNGFKNKNYAENNRDLQNIGTEKSKIGAFFQNLSGNEDENLQKSDDTRVKKTQKNGGEKDYYSPPPYYGFP